MTEFSAFWNGTTTGDASAAPYDANTEFAQWVKRGLGIGMNRANAGIVLGSGSESTQLEGLQVTQNSPAGMSVLLNVGAAQDDGTLYYNDAALTLAIAANASGNPRIDTIILRKSFAAQTVRAFVLAGTPAVTPAPPTLTQSAGVTWEIPIADIAVANGAASITAANITPRAVYTNAADGVYLDRILNNTASTHTSGEPMTFDPAADRAARSAAIAHSPVTAGVWQGRTAPAGLGRLLNRGIGYVRTFSAVTRGQYGELTSSGINVFVPTNEPTVNTICYFLETTSVAGFALAFIDAGMPQPFAPLLATARLTGAAASITLGGWQNVYNTLVIEFYLRSATAAASDTALFKWNGDGTAANYYSYNGFIALAAAAVTSVQNLAATGATQISVTGATAPAGVFAFGELKINNVMQAAAVKHISGNYYLQTTNANGGLSVVQVGGRHNDTNQITSLVVTLSSGANFAADSYINIYAKQTWG